MSKTQMSLFGVMAARGQVLAAGAVILAAGLTVGCQAEHAGLTLPTHRYLKDDVQYFDKGSGYPYARTQIAGQEAYMDGMGIPRQARADVPEIGPDLLPVDGLPPQDGGVGAPPNPF